MTPTAVAVHQPGILRQLRIATADQHHKLDSALNIGGTGFGLEGYKKLLERFYGIHAGWEPRAVAQLCGILPGLIERRLKLPLLQQDLMFLGLSAREIEGLPVCAAVAQSAGLADTIGAMYVLEGSTLGGQILSRHFAKQFGVTPDQGCAYFTGYGHHTGTMWREFGEMIESFATRSALQDEILQGARRMFASVHRWIVDGHE